MLGWLDVQRLVDLSWLFHAFAVNSARVGPFQLTFARLHNEWRSSRNLYNPILLQKKHHHLIRNDGAKVYRRPGSNRHALAGTGFWVQRVCLFRHAGILHIKIVKKKKHPRLQLIFSSVNRWLCLRYNLTGLAGFEPTMTESKSVALPLGYSPKMGRLMGIEPTNAGSTNRCVNHFATIAIIIQNRGSRIRTHTDGFGDRSTTIILYP